MFPVTPRLLARVVDPPTVNAVAITPEPVVASELKLVGPATVNAPGSESEATLSAPPSEREPETVNPVPIRAEPVVASELKLVALVTASCPVTSILFKAVTFPVSVQLPFVVKVPPTI